MSSTADPAARLAAALERIAQATARPATAPVLAPAPDPAMTEVAAGLDALIARVRAALGPDAAGRE